MSLTRRIRRLEDLWGQPSENEEKVMVWARLFAAVRCSEKGCCEDHPPNEADLEAARGFIDECRRLGKRPSLAAMLKLASLADDEGLES